MRLVMLASPAPGADMLGRTTAALLALDQRHVLSGRGALAGTVPASRLITTIPLFR
ncbi:hypothetical protein R2601_19050 [Salipiger bermudensis HTCC2601]|uniref:Uncharacterized protein n=1 Tax=Salipiger bermudensis (strain DSM 26914 / JCM 13377 / KCTC 12554 / HTCC2601) TaxID=314265 RepID=Q0FQU4_SALBH|nr:hypothetical protein R2601_19050 [Salipiger bermudensis HTCC2601]